MSAAALLLGATTACGPAAVVAPELPAAAPSPAPRTAAPATTAAASAQPRPTVPAGCSPRAQACVSTGTRQAWLQRHGRPSYGPVRISLGTRAHPTPRGTFRVAWKDAEHTSSTYGIPMPYSVFFAHGGIAFHEGPVDEASHGCVHLPRPAAFVFFSALERGDRIDVF